MIDYITRTAKVLQEAKQNQPRTWEVFRRNKNVYPTFLHELNNQQVVHPARKSVGVEGWDNNS